MTDKKDDKPKCEIIAKELPISLRKVMIGNEFVWEDGYFESDSKDEANIDAWLVIENEISYQHEWDLTTCESIKNVLESIDDDGNIRTKKPDTIILLGSRCKSSKFQFKVMGEHMPDNAKFIGCGVTEVSDFQAYEWVFYWVYNDGHIEDVNENFDVYFRLAKECGLNAEEALHMEMVPVQGGTFRLLYMTSDVILSSFYMDKYLITQAAYKYVMGKNPAKKYGFGDNYPVYDVSWYDAIEYCNRRSLQDGLTPCYSYYDGKDYGTDPANWPREWNESEYNHTYVKCDWAANGYRLPTDAEWEYAARGGLQTHGYTYSGSNTADDVAWYKENSDGTCHPVGKKASNELGIYDMSGNLHEWCWNIGEETRVDQVGNQTNPTGPVIGDRRTLRNGFWDDDANSCKVACSGCIDALDKWIGTGFRCVRIFP